MTAPGQERRAAIYARRSTAEQDESIGRQVAECERLIADGGWALSQVYSDTASGWRPHTPRPDFDAMIRDATAGKFDELVVWEVSRLSRQADDQSALSIIWRLRAAGVDVHSVTERATGVGLADDLTLLIKSHAAKEESDAKSRRVRSGKRLGVTRGVHQGRWAPYGYQDAGRVIVGSRAVKQYAPEPVAAAVVGEIFALFIGGASPQDLAHRLNDRRVPPPRPGSPHPMRRRGAAEWHQSTMRDLLANPLLGGFASYKGRRLKACGCASMDDPAAWDECPHDWVASANVPGIVPPEVWEQAEAVRLSRSRRVFGGRSAGSSDKFLLLGLAWCGHCGERLGCRADQSGGDRHRYICRGRRLGRCDMPPVLQADLDDAVRETFVRCFVDAVDLQATIERERNHLLEQRNGEASVLREEIALVRAELRSQESSAGRLRDDYLERRLSADQFSTLEEQVAARVADAQGRIDRLEARRDAVETAAAVDDVDALLDRWSSIQRILTGRLTASDVPTLNGQLAEVFSEFRLTRQGDRIIVEPALRPEWMPEGRWTTLDFGEDDRGGATMVEVVEHLAPVMRRVDLAGRTRRTTPTDSW